MSWLRRKLIRFGVGYFRSNGTEEEFWREAMRHAPFAYRWCGKSIAVADLDAQLGHHAEWIVLRKQIEAGDRIWPFAINPDTSAMRTGYVVVRKGKAIGGVVTIVS
jgi:hypothetical protein